MELPPAFSVTVEIMVATPWQPSDGQRLKFLRHAAGFDIQMFAKINSISVAQLKLLEDGADGSLFYSPAIKASVGRRLLSRLGETDASCESEQVLDTGKGLSVSQTKHVDLRVAESELQKLETLQTLDKVAADSVRDLDRGSSRKYVHAVSPQGRRQWYLLALLAAVALILVGNTNLLDSLLQIAPVPQSAARAVHTDTEVKTLVAAPAPAPAPDSIGPVVERVRAESVAVTEKESACRWSDRELELQPTSVRTLGNYVHFVASTDVTVCALDGRQTQTVLTLKAGDARSVRGVSPWHVYSRKLPELKVFYQGYHVPLPDTNTRHIGLRER